MQSEQSISADPAEGSVAIRVASTPEQELKEDQSDFERREEEIGRTTELCRANPSDENYKALLTAMGEMNVSLSSNPAERERIVAAIDLLKTSMCPGEEPILINAAPQSEPAESTSSTSTEETKHIVRYFDAEGKEHSITLRRSESIFKISKLLSLACAARQNYHGKPWIITPDRWQWFGYDEILEPNITIGKILHRYGDEEAVGPLSCWIKYYGVRILLVTPPIILLGSLRQLHLSNQAADSRVSMGSPTSRDHRVSRFSEDLWRRGLSTMRRPLAPQQW